MSQLAESISEIRPSRVDHQVIQLPQCHGRTSKRGRLALGIFCQSLFLPMRQLLTAEIIQRYHDLSQNDYLYFEACEGPVYLYGTSTAQSSVENRKDSMPAGLCARAVAFFCEPMKETDVDLFLRKMGQYKPQLGKATNSDIVINGAAMVVDAWHALFFHKSLLYSRSRQYALFERFKDHGDGFIRVAKWLREVFDRGEYEVLPKVKEALEKEAMHPAIACMHWTVYMLALKKTDGDVLPAVDAILNWSPDLKNDWYTPYQCQLIAIETLMAIADNEVISERANAISHLLENNRDYYEKSGLKHRW